MKGSIAHPTSFVAVGATVRQPGRAVNATPQRCERIPDTAVHGEYDPQGMAAASTPQAERQSVDGSACLIGIPRSLHAELMRAAEREHVSLNALVARTLAEAVEEPSPAPARWTSLALAANFAIVALAAIVGIVLLILAWTHGS
jgi:hypothetical protein